MSELRGNLEGRKNSDEPRKKQNNNEFVNKTTSKVRGAGMLPKHSATAAATTACDQSYICPRIASKTLN